MKKELSRRRFMYGVGTTAGALFVGPALMRAAQPNVEKIRIASVGVGGKGGSDVDHCAQAGGEIVGLCDVDKKTLGGKSQKYPGAKTFQDFRKMFESMEKGIDAVTVSTPDHLHGLVAGTAMKLGKHVYCQKPFVQTVWEARALRQLAKDKKLATQMGNQGSATPGLRRAVEVIQAGLIGGVKEVHIWSNRPIWPQGINRPAGEDPVPANLDWDLWLGPAAVRPFKQDVYHPFKWRGWFDFGTGALGDMACHTVNMSFRATKMGYPTQVELEDCTQLFPETFPLSSRIRFDFPSREGLPPMKFWWYDGNPNKNSKEYPDRLMRPGDDLIKDIVAMKGRLPDSGALLIGEKGKVFSPDDYGAQFYVVMNGEKGYMGSAKHEAAKAIPENFEKPMDGNNDLAMKMEWFRMIKEGKPSYSNFEIAGYLTEVILLGCIALRLGKNVKMDWDGPAMKSPNCPDAAKFVKRQARPGWELTI